MALSDAELAASVALERATWDAAQVVNVGWKVRTSLVAAANDCALRLAHSEGTWVYAGQEQATTDFVSGALRLACSAAADPDADDLGRLELAGIAVDESSLTAGELVSAMNAERIFWNRAGGLPMTEDERQSIPRTATALTSFAYYSWPLRWRLLNVVNDCARRLDEAAGFPPFLVPNRGVETFCAAALRVSVLATDSPTDADTGRLVLAGLA